MATSELARLVVVLEAQVAQFTTEMKEVRKQIARIEQTHTSAMKKIAAGAKMAMFAVRGFVSAWAGLKVIQRAREQLLLANRMGHYAERIGMSVEAFSALQFAADQAGIHMDNFGNTMQRLQRRIADVALGGGEATMALRAMHLDAKKLTQLPLEEQLIVVAEGLSRIADDSQRNLASFPLFEHEGQRFLQMMLEGSESIRDVMQEAFEMGVNVTKEQTEAAKEVDKALRKMYASIDRLYLRVGALAAGPVKNLANNLRAMLGGDTMREYFDWLIRSLAAYNKAQDNWFGRLTTRTADQRWLVEEILRVAKELEQTDILSLSDDAKELINSIPELVELYQVAKQPIEFDVDYFNEVFELRLETEDALAQIDKVKFELGMIDEYDPISLGLDVYATERTVELFRKVQNLRDGPPIELLVFEDQWDRLDRKLAELDMREQVQSTADIQTSFISEETREAFKKAQDDIDAVKERLERARDAADRFGFTFASAFEDAILSANSLRDVLKGLVDDLIRMFARLTVTEPMARFVSEIVLSGFSGLGGAAAAASGAKIDPTNPVGRASGGPVKANEVYVVGEEGPELFVSNVAGTIIPNVSHAVAPMLTNITNTVGTSEKIEKEQIDVMQKLVPGLDWLQGLTPRESGGSISPGRPYLVGESSAELFVPSGSTLVEHGSGSNINIQTIVNVDSRSDREQLRAELGPIVAQSVEASVNRVRQLSRRGRLL